MFIIILIYIIIYTVTSLNFSAFDVNFSSFSFSTLRTGKSNSAILKSEENDMKQNLWKPMWKTTERL